MEKIKKFFNDEEGATMVEYALMVALIAIACIAAVSFLAGGLKDTFNNVANQITGQ